MIHTTETYSLPMAIPTPSYMVDVQKMLGRSPPRSAAFPAPVVYSKDMPSSPPTSSPIMLRTAARKSVTDGRRTPSPSPRRRGSLHRHPAITITNSTASESLATAMPLRNKRGEVIPSILRPQRTSSSDAIHLLTAPKRPELKKSITFDGKIERICLFERGSLPAEIPSAERYDIDDSGDVDAGSVSSSLAISSTWTLKSQNLPALTAFGQLPVVLDTITLDEGKMITGTILVRNIAFEKFVAVRYTADNWTTSADVQATYAGVVSMPHQQFTGVDRFRFAIDVNEDLDMGLETELNLQFAIVYKVAGQEWWDNNGHQNYAVTLTRPEHAPTRPVPRKQSTSSLRPMLAWEKPTRPRSQSAVVRSPTTKPEPIVISQSLSLPLSPEARRESRRAVSLAKSGGFSDPFERYAATAGSGGYGVVETGGVEIPFSSSYPYMNVGTRKSGLGIGGDEVVEKPNGRSRLYADEQGDPLSSLACSPPGSFAACRA